MAGSVRLFEPLSVREAHLANRVVVAPMCQYSAVDGKAQDWHLQHYGALASSGPGMVVIEATAVSPAGRITGGCLGLYSDETEAALGHLVRAVKSFGQALLAVQLGHAGRKASALRPWEGGGPLAPLAGGWRPVSASPVPFDQGWPVPEEAGAYELAAILRDFVAAAQRADRIGLDAVELHAAHGYLLHQFLSPLSNLRTDAYGGSLEGRMRFPLEVVRAVRKVWPARKPLGMRISATDWMPGGVTLDDAVRFVEICKAEGVDYVCVSSGGLTPQARPPAQPGYQVALAERIRNETGILTRAVGLIARPEEAERVLDAGAADLVALGRAFLDDPRWVWRAAQSLGVATAYPPQYLRAQPKLWPMAQAFRPVLS